MPISATKSCRPVESVLRIRCGAALALCLALAASGAFAQDGARTVILVARPGLSDANFRESVVLVTQDEHTAATGVIINRPTDRSLAQLLPGDRFKRFDEPVFFGGPVAANGLFAVFFADRDPGQSLAMLPGLYFAIRPDTIDALIGNPPPRIRFFAGYSGWAPGQLRAEFERGDWLAVDADAEVVFRKDSANLWQEMVRRATAVHASRPVHTLAGIP
jgi:putative transcriptional regulator